ncbi:hypothetical protein OEZ86_010095 [Tetradesmus obliquus]|uniref:Uncharacterized protein n=1 Tax=Tetradesmus obliquus TaxID=3088 RepID=A0ABY8UPK9_TETOB|nr:hypothetical protein OEZ85_001529 [Tetradesmus obliquus]WIA43656.1 hypothetical protein OEZ86_010095 [Tetradesmus obliquus]
MSGFPDSQHVLWLVYDAAPKTSSSHEPGSPVIKFNASLAPGMLLAQDIGLFQVPAATAAAQDAAGAPSRGAHLYQPPVDLVVLSSQLQRLGPSTPFSGVITERQKGSSSRRQPGKAAAEVWVGHSAAAAAGDEASHCSLLAELAATAEQGAAASWGTRQALLAKLLHEWSEVDQWPSCNSEESWELPAHMGEEEQQASTAAVAATGPQQPFGQWAAPRSGSTQPASSLQKMNAGSGKRRPEAAAAAAAAAAGGALAPLSQQPEVELAAGSSISSPRALSAAQLADLAVAFDEDARLRSLLASSSSSSSSIASDSWRNSTEQQACSNEPADVAQSQGVGQDEGPGFALDESAAATGGGNLLHTGDGDWVAGLAGYEQQAPDEAPQQQPELPLSEAAVQLMLQEASPAQPAPFDPAADDAMFNMSELAAAVLLHEESSTARLAELEQEIAAMLIQSGAAGGTLAL